MRADLGKVKKRAPFEEDARFLFAFIGSASANLLSERAVGVEGRHLVEGDGLDLRALAFAAEFEVALLARVPSRQRAQP